MAEDLGAVWQPGTIPDASTVVVKRIEGFSSAPYDDNGGLPGGTWTIGYGSIVDAAGNPVTAATPPIDSSQADALLLRDMTGAAKDVSKRVAVQLLVREAAALISWTYNLGDGNLRSSTMLSDINGGDKAAVPGEMRKWTHQAGRPLVGLLRRRWAEAAIFVGVDPTNACVRAWKEIETLTDWPPFGV
jgi:lysozyme